MQIDGIGQNKRKRMKREEIQIVRLIRKFSIVDSDLIFMMRECLGPIECNWKEKDQYFIKKGLKMNKD